MAKRIFAALSLLAAFGLGLQPAAAQPAAYSVDGCAKLARVVYAEVSNAALYGPGQGGPWPIEHGSSDVAECDHVAKTVSRAFSSAMLGAGYPVQFSTSYGGSGDYCLSAFLSQCYPSREPLSMGGVAGGFAFKTWAAVTQTIMRQMHNPFSSDRIQFSDNDLKLRLGLTLRSVKGRELH